MDLLISWLLITTFGSAALWKIRFFRRTSQQLRHYTRSPQAANVLVVLVIACELGLTALLVRPSEWPAAGFLGTGFLVASSGFLALRLISRSSPAACPCWGKEAPLRDLRDPHQSSTGALLLGLATPALQSLRNGALIGALLSLGHNELGIEASFVPPLFIAVGLAASVFREHLQLKRKPHPAERYFAPFLESVILPSAQPYRNQDQSTWLFEQGS